MGEIAKDKTLSDEINAATRTPHTLLNNLITSRLPLALPPHASDSKPYATGIHHFSYIFLTFESLWADLVASVPTPETQSPPTSPLLSYLLVNPYDSPEPFTDVPSPPPSLIRFLADLRPKGLARSARVKRDLGYLLDMSSTDLSVLLSQYPGPKVAEFCAHIRSVVRQRPHVLLAYAWCYYMAVFSGGRWIRGQLMNAGEGFWRREDGGDQGSGNAPQLPLQDKGMALWNFEGDNDGDDIKAEFKRRLAEADTLLSLEQRQDIVEEAKEIFRFSALLVKELDEKLQTDMSLLEPARQRRKRAEEKGKDSGGKIATRSQDFRARLRWPEVTAAMVGVACVVAAAFWGMNR